MKINEKEVGDCPFFNNVCHSTLSSWHEKINLFPNEDNFKVLPGTMSVPKSMHKIVTVPSGKGISQMMKSRKGDISGILEVSV